MEDKKSASHAARGRKGGEQTAKRYGKKHMAEIGRKGADRVAEILGAGKRYLDQHQHLCEACATAGRSPMPASDRYDWRDGQLWDRARGCWVIWETISGKIGMANGMDRLIKRLLNDEPDRDMHLRHDERKRLEGTAVLPVTPESQMERIGGK